MNQEDKTPIGLNQPLKIRFSDGQEMNVVILDQKHKTLAKELPYGRSVYYWCSKDSPLAQAILGKSPDQTIEYSVSGNIQKVTILGILG